jgi:hypothetical protein
MEEIIFVTLALISAMIGAVYSSTLIIKVSELLNKCGKIK